MHRTRTRAASLAIVAAATIAAGCTAASGGTVVSQSPPAANAAATVPGAKLDHLIFIVQENRSFDHYYGTYPGADGIPTKPDGSFAVCVPDPWQGGKCVPPYVAHKIDFDGGPHDKPAAIKDIDGGKMDGFVGSLDARPTKCWVDRTLPHCDRILGPQGQPDVMSTLRRGSIPNYWGWADRFVLQDEMFTSADSWSLPSHLFLVSGWSAFCSDPKDPMSCRSNLTLKRADQRWDFGDRPNYAWTDVTWLLDKAGVSWRYYIGDDTCWEPPCPGPNDRATSSKAVFMPIAGFTSFWDGERDGIHDNVRSVHRYLDAAQGGTLPDVSWIMPSSGVSDHPASPSTIRTSMAYVTRLVNAAMKGPEWDSTAIFITWDDWGGFYDHVQPQKIDRNGYGLRVPGLVISPYAKEGYIDHTQLSFDSYLKLIENRFLGGQRLDPATDGRPDARPTVREPKANDMWNAFDFTQPPRAPVIEDPWPWPTRPPRPLF
jgi:phospholipase C